MTIELTDEQTREAARLISESVERGTFAGLHTVLGAIAEATRPAPTYREGEMRWIILPSGDKRLVVIDAEGHMSSVPGYNWHANRLPNAYTLSEPVVVFPAPTDEERAELLETFPSDHDPDNYSDPLDKWFHKIAQALRNQEARDA